VTDPMHISKNIVPQLRALGVGQALIDSLFRDNPRRYFTGETLSQKATDKAFEAVQIRKSNPVQ
jgi:hypothetical protein